MKVNGKNIRDRVLMISRSDPRIANDDLLLIATIWYQEGWHDPSLYSMLKKVTSPETIRRTRQKLVQEGLIKPSEKTVNARYNDFKEAKKDLGYN